MAYTSAFLVNRNALIGTSCEHPTQYPQSDAYMYWPTGVTKSWPTNLFANYQRHKEMWGARNPQIVRMYNNNPGSRTGVTGSAGSYGLITSDARSIANDGAYICLTFKTGGQGASAWNTLANNLNSSTDNATKVEFRNIALNLKAWVADTGNTAAVKKIILGYHHEPENDVPSTPDADYTTGANAYVAATRAIITYLARRGVGDAGLRPNVPLDTASAPGGAVTVFTDCVEWACVLMAWQDRGLRFWPGDFATDKSYCRWLFADPYNWGGGQSSPGNPNPGRAQFGEVVQPGDPTGENYQKAWQSIRNPLLPMLNWSDTHPNTILGIGEFATSEYVDKFTGDRGEPATLPKVWSAIPAAKGEWYRQVPRLAQGLASSGVTATTKNNFPADSRMRRIKAWIYWNNQAAMPRWFNTVPFQPNDVTGPSTTGAARSLSYDGFVAMVNDAYWNVGAGPVRTDPTITAYNPRETPGDTSGMSYTFTASATPGSGAIASYTFNFGDNTPSAVISTTAGTATTTHTYATEGPKSTSVTVLAADGADAVRTLAVTVVKAGEPDPEIPVETIEPLSGAPLLQPGTPIADLRFPHNEAVKKLAQFTESIRARRFIKTVTGTAYTLTAEDAGGTIEFTAATAVTVTVPNNSAVPFPSGTHVDLIQVGAGVVSVVGASGVTVQTPAGSATRARFSTIRVAQRSVVNTWLLSQDLATGSGTTPVNSGITPTTDNIDINFNTGPAGAAIILQPWTSKTGADAVYNADAIDGNFSAQFNTTAQTSSYRRDITPAQGLAWFAFYFKIVSALPAAQVYLMEWFGTGGTAKIGDLRLNTNGSLTIRDNITAVITSTTTLTVGEWNRVAVKADPGVQHALRVYTGANLNTMTATYSGTGAATQTADVDMLRVGSMTATTFQYRMDRLRGNTTEEPSPVPT